MAEFINPKAKHGIVLAILAINFISYIFLLAPNYFPREIKFFLQFVMDATPDFISNMPLFNHLLSTLQPFDVVYMVEMLIITSLLFCGLIKRRRWAWFLGIGYFSFLVVGNLSAAVQEFFSLEEYFFLFILYFPILFLPPILLAFLGLFFLLKNEKMFEGADVKDYLTSFSLKKIAVLVILLSIFVIGYVYAEDICFLGVNSGRYTGLSCFTSVAAMKGNIKICEEAIWAHNGISQSAAYSCKKGFAEIMLLPEICEELESDSCLKYVAQRLGDSSFCSKINDDAIKANCYEATT